MLISWHASIHIADFMYFVYIISLIRLMWTLFQRKDIVAN